MVEHRTFMRSSIFAATCVLAACAGPVTLVDSPTVRLQRIESGHLGFDRQTFVLGFEISNPNPFPLPVRSLSYDVSIAGEQFASGKTEGEFSVPGNGDGSFAISVELDMMRQASSLASMLRAGSRGSVPYELRGSLTVDIPFTRPIAFSNSGSISIASGP